MVARGMVLAVFTWPALFYWGAAAVSLPIIIHLLARRRFKRVRWAAMEFLLQAQRENRRKINLRELILLLLRCLAMLLLGLLLARPFLSPGQVGAALGTQPPTTHLIMLDDSFSMGHSSGGRSTLDQATAAVAHVVDGLRRQAPRDRLVVLRSSTPGQPLMESPDLESLSSEELRQALAPLVHSHLAARFDDWLGQLRADTEGRLDAGPVALYIFSDFQRSDWVGTAGGDAARGNPLKILEGWPRERVPLELTCVQLAPGLRSNLALVELRSAQPQIVSGVENRFSATAVNFGDQAIPPQALQIFLDDAAQAAVPVPQLDPGQRVELAFALTPAVRGPQALRVQLPPDALALDNERSLAASVQTAVEVLVINGEPGGDVLVDEVSLLQTALQPEGDVFSGIAVTVADESELDGARFEDAHVVVLANVNRPSEEVCARLEAFVAGGGGLAIFLGDQVDAAIYNERLWKDGAGLLPGALGRLRLSPPGQRPPGIVDKAAGHPLLRVFGGAENPFRRSVGFWAYYECEVPAPTEDQSAAPPVRVVAEFSDDQQSLAMAEKSFGEGRVLLVTSSVDLEWNDWAKSPSYVVAMLEMVQYLAARAGRSSVIAGTEVRIPAREAGLQHEAAWRRPGYPVVPDTTILAQPAGEDFEWRLRPLEVGMHRLRLRDAQGQDVEHLLAVNTDPRESDLASCTEKELRQAAPEVPFRWIDDVRALDTVVSAQKKELWPVVLVCAAALLFIEQYLAERFGRL